MNILRSFNKTHEAKLFNMIYPTRIRVDEALLHIRITAIRNTHVIYNINTNLCHDSYVGIKL